MFLHGGWGHLGGNMLFLWIFGDNIEHRLGHVRFVVFYLACGLAASLAHIMFNSGSTIPAVGASGAISGVLGGYLLMFPRNRVYVLTWGGVMAVPAIFMLGLWIVTQFINGVGSIAVTNQSGGVAYMAHIGGFVAGLILAPLFGRGRATVMTAPRRNDRWR
jgi:membrane associated rhomboid family serine protease